MSSRCAERSNCEFIKIFDAFQLFSRSRSWIGYLDRTLSEFFEEQTHRAKGLIRLEISVWRALYMHSSMPIPLQNSAYNVPKVEMLYSLQKTINIQCVQIHSIGFRRL